MPFPEWVCWLFMVGTIVLVPSLIGNIKSFRSFTKKYAIKLWIVEERLQDAGIDITEDAQTGGTISTKWVVAAVVVILVLAVTTVIFATGRVQF